jgi:hypothetical protein
MEVAGAIKQIAVTALRDCLCEDWESARLRLRELDLEQLKELQRACMALQNLTMARQYTVAQQNARHGKTAKQAE